MNGLSVIVFDDTSQMGVEGGSLGARVSEEILQATKPHATFDQVGSKTVSEGVYGDFFLNPHSCTTFLNACCTVPWLIGFCAD